jgi:hypothetical protein
MSVVDGHLKVYGIENLRIADGSILLRGSGQLRKGHNSLALFERSCSSLKTGSEKLGYELAAKRTFSERRD